MFCRFMVVRLYGMSDHQEPLLSWEWDGLSETSHAMQVFAAVYVFPMQNPEVATVLVSRLQNKESASLSVADDEHTAEDMDSYFSKPSCACSVLNVFQQPYRSLPEHNTKA